MSRQAEHVEVPASEPDAAYLVPTAEGGWLFPSGRSVHRWSYPERTVCGRYLGEIGVVRVPIGWLRLDVVLPCRRCYP